MKAHDNAEVILTIFRAVERRDGEAFQALCQPDVALHWPPPLPYGESFGAGTAETRQGPNWEETWGPLQPTDGERQMDPRVVAADNDEVVVLWRQRGVSPAGERFDGQVLGLYQFRDGKLARAQMFYFDPAGATRFLTQARLQTPVSNRQTDAA
jgi:ketosteroid isomerase-like protein